MNHTLISHTLERPSISTLKLWNHLDQTIEISKKLISSKSMTFSGISKMQITEICALAAACHDFGKSTLFFQDYIKSEAESKNYNGGIREKSHALISAFFGYYFVEKWISDKDLESHWKAFLPFAVFLAIEGHHSTYKSIDDILSIIDKNISLIERQINNIYSEIYNYNFDSIDLSLCCDFNINKINSISSKLRKFSREYKRAPKGFDRNKWLDIQIEHRILALLIYSILLEADKAFLASDSPSQYSRDSIPLADNLVDNYITEISDNKAINESRNRAYRETIKKIATITEGERIHSITLPTGLGKTLLSASWALKLRDKIRKDNGFIPKIIVSLPFLSIIEQTDEEYKNFLGILYEQYRDRLYFSSYSISDFSYKDGIDDNERSKNSIDFFLNIWNAEVIVTTYDQLLYSLFSLKAKYLMRFHNLFNSIIIFDEVQAFPSELWTPFEKFFSKLAEVGNTHILLMSATQPGFMPDSVEQVPNPEEYFAERKRVRLHIVPKKEKISEFLKRLPDLLNIHAHESLMLVLNTRESSKLVFKEAKKLLIDSRPAFYLSSLVAPSQRLERISRIKNSIKKNENPLIVTTQCIEAGVDIDIDYVIRDWAPLDSIFQVCGRCNRNGLKELGIVEVLNLEADNGRAFSKTIYDDIKLDSTSFSLGEIGLVVDEASFYKLGKKYFDLVRKNNCESMKIVNAYAQYSHVYEERGKEIAVNIKKLLRDDEYQEQFIVSSLDSELIDDIQQALDIEDRWERHYEIRSLRKRIAANSVNVQFYKGMQIQPDDLTKRKIGNFRVLDEQFYDRSNVGLDINPREPLGGTLMFSD